MFANPAYTPASASAEALDLPRAAAAPTTRKTSIQAIKAAIMSKAVLIRNPLEAFQRRSASLHVQVAPQEPEVSAQADAAERTIKKVLRHGCCCCGVCWQVTHAPCSILYMSDCYDI